MDMEDSDGEAENKDGDKIERAQRDQLRKMEDNSRKGTKEEKRRKTSSAHAQPEEELNLNVYAIEHTCKFYGYGLLCSITGILQTLGISLLPLTNWNARDGIPRYNPWVLVPFLHAKTLWDSLLHPFGYGIYDPPTPSEPTEGWKYAWSWMLPYWLVVNNVIVFVGYTLPTLLGKDPLL